MKKNIKLKYLLIVCIYFIYIPVKAQNDSFLNVFKYYNNDTLSSNDLKLKESPIKTFTADEVLNNSLHWKNPYPIILNNNLDGFALDRIGDVAKKGVYPRIFTTPNDFATINDRLLHSKIGSQLLSLAKIELEKLNNKSTILGKAYNNFLNTDTIVINANFPTAEFANILAIKGLLAQLAGDTKVFNETSKVSAHFIQSWIRLIDETPQVVGKELMVKEQVYSGAKMAKLFDFTATGMTNAQKNVYTKFMLRETTAKYGDGMQLPNHWRRWNHIASSLAYPLTALSIENEPGFDRRIYDRGVELLQDYLTYTYSPEGMSDEGITYTFGPFADDLLFMSAIAKRGKADIWGNPHFRNIPDWLIQSLNPNYKAMWSSHGDTGSTSDIPWVMMLILKYYFPNDLKVDYLFSNALPDKFEKLPDVSAFVFAIDPIKSKYEYNGIPPVNMPLTFFSAQRGSFITRSKWTTNAVQFQLDARQDMLFQSHDHSDRGNFELAANGRNWVVDGWRSTESKYHSVVTIDGRGQGYFATPASWLNYVDNESATFGLIDQKYAYDWLWLKSPVADLLNNKKVALKWQTGVYADVSKNLTKYYPGIIPMRDPLRKVADYFSGNLATNPLIWNEDTWPMRMPNFTMQYAFRTAGLIKGKHPYVLIADDIKKDDQERLYEWLMPMPLDVEVVSIKQLVDVKQESGALNIGFNTLTNKGVQGDYDILLGDKSMKRNMQEVDTEAGETYRSGRFIPQNGNAQLLVRVLNRTAAPIPNLEPNPRLEVIEKLKTEDMHQFYLRTMDIGKRLVIPSRSAAPNFKILLFPHLSGEALPQTKWNEDRTILEVNFIDQHDVLFFSKTAENRTKLKLLRDNKIVFDL